MITIFIGTWNMGMSSLLPRALLQMLCKGVLSWHDELQTLCVLWQVCTPGLSSPCDRGADIYTYSCMWFDTSHGSTQRTMKLSLLGAEELLKWQGIVAGTKLVQQCTSSSTLQKGQDQFHKLHISCSHLPRDSSYPAWEDSWESVVLRERDRMWLRTVEYRLFFSLLGQKSGSAAVSWAVCAWPSLRNKVNVVAGQKYSSLIFLLTSLGLGKLMNKRKVVKAESPFSQWLRWGKHHPRIVCPGWYWCLKCLCSLGVSRKVMWDIKPIISVPMCYLHPGFTGHDLTSFGVWCVDKRCSPSPKEDHLLVPLQGAGEDPWWHCWLHPSWHICDWHPGGSPRREGMAGDPKAISAGNHQYQLQSGEGLFQLLHGTHLSRMYMLYK